MYCDESGHLHNYNSEVMVLDAIEYLKEKKRKEKKRKEKKQSILKDIINKKYNLSSYNKMHFYFILLNPFIEYNSDYNIFIDIKDTNGSFRVKKFRTVR